MESDIDLYRKQRDVEAHGAVLHRMTDIILQQSQDFTSELRMEVTDFNGEGRWSRSEILARYASYAAAMGIVSRDLSPREHSEGGRRWVFPVMERVIDGIADGDPACVRLGVEFIEEDAKFRFGKT